MFRLFRLFIFICVIKIAWGTPRNESSKQFRRKRNSEIECGKSSVTGLVHGGDLVTRGEFPWMVAIFMERQGLSPAYACGGTLVAANKVVTAAHCVHLKGHVNPVPFQNFILLLGAFNLDNHFENGRMILTPSEIIIHEGWDPKTLRFDDDIAVLMLRSEICYTDFIRPICMLTSNTSGSSDGKWGTVAGWGKSEDHSKVNENIAKKLKLPIESNEHCYRNNSKLADIAWEKSFCAGQFGVAVCVGDSGSALTVKINGKYHFKGLVSSSISSITGCNTEDYAIYTDVSKYSEFIQHPKGSFHNTKNPPIPNFYSGTRYCNDGLGICTASAKCSNATYFNEKLRFNVELETDSCHYLEMCCDPEDVITLNSQLKTTGCGLRNKDGIGNSVTNSIDDAQYAEFPWMAALSEILISGEVKYICGGSLINEKVVLTAAHCIRLKNRSALRVRLGEWDTQTTREMFPHIDHKVAQAVVHPGFVHSSLFNDVVLLVLKNPAELGVHINTVCLPPQNFNFDRDTCFSTGWGTDKLGRDELRRVNLKKIELPVVPFTDCQESLRDTKLGPHFRMHANFMCAGGERDNDTCTGDGGGPLVCPIPGKDNYFHQAGIVSWGVDCGQENIPAVYANVARFRTWIDQQMNTLGYGTSSYTAN